MTIYNLTLAELMGEPHAVWLNKSKQFGYDLHIEGYDNDVEINERSIHPCAVDGFAEFCRKFLSHYDRLNNK
jgi:hypothetical protein